MATPGSRDASATTGRADSLQGAVREWMITGAALTIPFIITVMVLAFVLDFVANALTPVVEAARLLGLLAPVEATATALGIGPSVGPVFIQAGTVVVLLATVFVVGFVASRTSAEGGLSQGFHGAMEAIPGVGSVYTSFRRMSDVLVESDTDSFQEVKLIEFPNEWTYSFAFVTAEPPSAVESGAGETDLRTLFMPLAPNPVMGGFLVNVPDERVYEVDMTVEEAISAIVTSGVAIGNADSTTSLSPDELAALGQYETERTNVGQGTINENTGVESATERGGETGSDEP